jgi:starch-binding outer membrane protein, SusD/RagB family
MRKKFLYSFFVLFLINTLFTACKKDLTVIPNSLLETELIFTDKNLITSTLARFYQQISAGGAPNAASSPNANRGWGQNNDDWNKFQQDPDDGINNNGAPSTGNLSWGRDRYRALDYGLIRRMNQFLAGIRSDEARKALTVAERVNFEAQAIFLRAYTYFWMTRTLGGMTIVGDTVFTYTAGQDISPYRMHRNSEADCYQYIMEQCDSAAAKFTFAAISNSALGTAPTINASIVNKWTAFMLKARAAITAASIAKYTPLRAPGNVKKDGRGVDVVGIPVSKADSFYTVALAAADSVIKKSPYVLMTSSTDPERAFYNATTIKAGNTEVIWATDRKLGTPARTEFTRHVAPVSAGHNDGQVEGNSLGATLNLVESFENRDGSDPKIRDKNPDGTYVVYDDVQAPFKAKDARLWGTVIWPEAIFRGTPVPLRAGELLKLTTPYNASSYKTSAPSRTNNTAATGPNGPADVSTNFVNKTGFGVRKWLDETTNSGQAPNYSEVWWPRFRLAEAYMIAAEAAFELNNIPEALTNINKIRTERGRIQPLTAATLTFDKIVNENRVEFAFEDHRVWDLIRWRMAHIIWNGIDNDANAQPLALYAYRVNVPAPGDQTNNGKWVFEKKKAYRRTTTPFNFPQEAYYSSLNLDWVNPKNPNWVLNPYQ